MRVPDSMERDVTQKDRVWAVFNLAERETALARQSYNKPEPGVHVAEVRCDHADRNNEGPNLMLTPFTRMLLGGMHLDDLMDYLVKQVERIGSSDTDGNNTRNERYWLLDVQMLAETYPPAAPCLIDHLAMSSVGRRAVENARGDDPVWWLQRLVTGMFTVTNTIDQCQILAEEKILPQLVALENPSWMRRPETFPVPGQEVFTSRLLEVLDGCLPHIVDGLEWDSHRGALGKTRPGGDKFLREAVSEWKEGRRDPQERKRESDLLLSQIGERMNQHRKLIEGTGQDWKDHASKIDDGPIGSLIRALTYKDFGQMSASELLTAALAVSAQTA